MKISILNFNRPCFLCMILLIPVFCCFFFLDIKPGAAQFLRPAKTLDTPLCVWENNDFSIIRTLSLQDDIQYFNLYYDSRPLLKKGMPGFNGAASIISNDYSSPATLVCALFSFDGGPESSVYTFVLKEGIVKNLPSPLNGDAPVNVKKINNTIMLNRFASIRDDMFDINHDFIISTWSLGITGWKQIRPSGNETGLDKSAETLFYADLAFKEGEFEKAAYGFKSIVNNKSILDKHKEIYARALYYLAKSYQASGNIKSAVIQYEEFVNLFSTHIFADNAQKESQFLDMSSRFGDTLLKHYLNANNLFLSSEHDKAFEIIRYALSESRSPQNESYIQPLLCRAFYLAGQLSEKLNIHDQALSYYEKGALCAGEESVKRQCVSSALRLKK